MLLLASIACVLVLILGFVSTREADLRSLSVSHIALLALVVTAAGLAAFLVWRTTGMARREVRRARVETARLKQRLASCDAIINAEPQALLFWERGGTLRVVSQTLKGLRGLPQAADDLLDFPQWLDPHSAETLSVNLNALFTEGQPFNLILKTQALTHLEADGRAAAGRAIVRLRGIAGYKRDISRISDTHQHLAREIRTTRALLDALPMPAWLRDDHGHLTWANAAYVAAVEADGIDEVLTRQTEFLERRQRQKIFGALNEDAPYRERLQLITRGERREHDVIVQKLKGGIAGVAIDLAAFEGVRGELERQIAAYDRALDRVDTAVCLFNSERSVVFFNDAYADLWQLDSGWLKSGPKESDVLDRLREEGRLPEVVNYQEWRSHVLGTEDTWTEREDRWHLPDGRVVHVMIEHRPDGSVIHLYADETERIALESRFNANIKVQRETLNSLTEGVAVFATDGRLKLHNSAFTSIWRLSPKMLATHPHIDDIVNLARVLFDDEAAWNQLKTVITSISDQRTPVTGQMVRPDNSVIDYSTTPLPDGATLLTFVDVTDSKRYERALVERNEALEASDRIKNQFIGHISYELRTPLTNIIGFSELLNSPHFGSLTDKQREYLQDISFSSETLLAIIDGILDLATIDARALELNLETLSTRNIIDAAIHGVQERAARADITIDIAIADDATTIRADATRVRQMLYNLLSNAVGFSRSGGEVRVSCWRDKDSIVFQVKDYGVGIERERRSKVFERFESDSQGMKHRGPGLGLSIVKGLVDLHGGRISLASEPGQGTAVNIRLPADGVNARSNDRSVEDQPSRGTLDRSA